jgi:hypothetical protein
MKAKVVAVWGVQVTKMITFLSVLKLVYGDDKFRYLKNLCLVYDN